MGLIVLVVGLIFVGLLLFSLMRCLDPKWSGKIKDLFRL